MRGADETENQISFHAQWRTRIIYGKSHVICPFEDLAMRKLILKLDVRKNGGGTMEFFQIVVKKL